MPKGSVPVMLHWIGWTELNQNEMWREPEDHAHRKRASHVALDWMDRTESE